MKKSDIGWFILWMVGIYSAGLIFTYLEWEAIGYLITITPAVFALMAGGFTFIGGVVFLIVFIIETLVIREVIMAVVYLFLSIAKKLNNLKK